MSGSNCVNESRWTYKKKFEREHVMKIDNFSLWFNGTGSSSPALSSPTFKLDKLEWYTKVSRSSVPRCPKSLSIELQLFRYDCNLFDIECVLSVIDSSGRKSDCQRIKVISWSNYNSKKDIGTISFAFDPAILSRPVDRLTLHFNVEFFSVENQAIIQVPDGKLIKDIHGLLKSVESADVILMCKGEQFKAHKTILGSRSRVFAAMFKHDFKEKKDSVVEIVDMEKDVLREMLHYIYTDEASSGLGRLANGLLAAANKYDLERLRIMCEYSLAAKLTIENAIETLIAADIHSAHQLKQSAIQFIKNHKVQVLKTAGWKLIIGGNFAGLTELIK